MIGGDRCQVIGGDRRCGCAVQAWLEALEEHSAYSTHYCSQDQSGEEEENEEELLSAVELKESLQVANNNNNNTSIIYAST